MPKRIVERLEVIEVEHRDPQWGIPAVSTMQLAPQSVFQVAPVEQPGQGIMGGLCAQFLAKLQVGQTQLDRFAHHHGQWLLVDLAFASPRGNTDETQQPQYFTLHYQRRTQVVGHYGRDEMTAQPYP